MVADVVVAIFEDGHIFGGIRSRANCLLGLSVSRETCKIAALGKVSRTSGLCVNAPDKLRFLVITLNFEHHSDHGTKYYHRNY